MRIESKSQMYAMLERGAFGNQPRVNAQLHGYKGPVCVRTLRPGGPFKICDGIVSAVTFGASLQEPFQVSELVNGVTIQGEVQRQPGGLYLRYTTVDKPMRVAWKDEERHAHGLAAQALIQHHMDAASWDDLNELLDAYDGAVIEFSCHSHDVGVCLRRNTIFWEVRHY